jgi:hypothetical protein
MPSEPTSESVRNAHHDPARARAPGDGARLGHWQTTVVGLTGALARAADSGHRATGIRPLRYQPRSWIALEDSAGRGNLSTEPQREPQSETDLPVALPFAVHSSPL